MGILKSVRSTFKGGSADADLRLLKAIAAGDVTAFERLHGQYFAKLMHFAKRVIDSTEAAEEIANDTLMVVWRTADRFEGRSKPSSWIFGIAYRLALKQARSNGRHKGTVALEEDMAHDGENTADTIMNQKDIHAALQQLTPELRAVVELTYYNGYLYKEIAEILGCPVGTVKTRMMTARQRLHDMLSDDLLSYSENAVA